jgi:hypothetical protein
VDELGTISAAATGAAISPLSASSDIMFNANKPFILLLTDLVEGTWLFGGVYPGEAVDHETGQEQVTVPSRFTSTRTSFTGQHRGDIKTTTPLQPYPGDSGEPDTGLEQVPITTWSYDTSSFPIVPNGRDRKTSTNIPSAPTPIVRYTPYPDRRRTSPPSTPDVQMPDGRPGSSSEHSSGECKEDPQTDSLPPLQPPYAGPPNRQSFSSFLAGPGGTRLTDGKKFLKRVAAYCVCKGNVDSDCLNYYICPPGYYLGFITNSASSSVSFPQSQDDSSGSRSQRKRNRCSQQEDSEPIVDFRVGEVSGQS